MDYRKKLIVEPCAWRIDSEAATGGRYAPRRYDFH